jgi:spermidine/putrescine transport system ATP-binding protein
MSDGVAVMNGGRFEQVGSPQALYHHPATAFVAGFVGDTNRWAGRIRQVSAEGVSIETDTGLSMVCDRRGSHAHEVGAAADIFVRPEFIQMNGHGGNALNGENAINTLDGRVESLLFNGANSRVLVRGPNEELIEADVVLTGGTSDPKPGDDVRLAWAPRQTMCFGR